MARYRLIDEEHNTYECSECGHMERFEADGPYENGWTVCPACGEEIETDE